MNNATGRRAFRRAQIAYTSKLRKKGNKKFKAIKILSRGATKLALNEMGIKNKGIIDVVHTEMGLFEAGEKLRTMEENKQAGIGHRMILSAALGSQQKAEEFLSKHWKYLNKI